MSRDKLVREEEDCGSMQYCRQDECPDCGSINVVYEISMEKVVCQDCGSVFEELVPV